MNLTGYKNKNTIKQLIQIIVWLAAFVTAFAFVADRYSAWNDLYLSSCPNKDSLVWDGNMRFVQAIDIVDDARRGILWPGVESLLASPTWPPLRTLLSIGLLIYNGSPDPVLDGRPSVFFWFASILLLAVFGFFAVSLRRSSKENGVGRSFFALCFLTTVFLLLGMFDLPQFIFSSMLELQGMFFFTANTWAAFLILKRIDDQKINKQASKQTNKQINKQLVISKRLLWTFALTGAGLYLTKYPFGILTSLSLLVVVVLRSPTDFFAGVVRLIKERYTGWHLISFTLLVVAVGIIFVGPYLGPGFANTKIVKRLLYVSVLVIFIDFNHYLYRKQPQFFSTELNIFYLYFILPFVIVMLSHPDRFGSLVQAQTDTVPGGSRFYPVAIFTEYFLQSPVIWFVVLGGLAIAVTGLVLRRDRSESKSEPKSEPVKISPDVQMIVFVWANVLIMQFMSSNHQARYLFQVFPLFLFFHIAQFVNLADWLKGRVGQLTVFAIVLALCIFAARPFLTETAPMPDVCFATTDPRPIDAARRLATHLPADIDAVLLNDFHETTSPEFGRRQATEIDLFMRYRVYNHGKIRTDSKYRYPKWTDHEGRLKFQELVHVSFLCSNDGQAEVKAANRANSAGTDIEPIESYFDADGLCMTRYRLRPR